MLLTELLKDGESMLAFGEFPLHVGFRAGELLSRRWGHFDLAQAFVGIDETKTDRPRRVSLNSRAFALLTELRQGAADDELVFDPHRTGRRRRQMLYASEAAVRRAGIPYGRNVRWGLTYHGLRRTFATKPRAAAVHQYDTADLLGHSTTPAERRDTKVTRGCSRAVPSRLREAVESTCTLNVVEFWREQA